MSSLTVPTSVQEHWATIGIALLSATAIYGVSRTLLASDAPTHTTERIYNYRGEAIPHCDEDTRFSRFSHGKELGDRLIKELGPIYTFQSGNLREL